MPDKKIPISIALTKERYDKLTHLAETNGRKRSAYVRQILNRYLQYMDIKNDPFAPPVNWDIPAVGQPDRPLESLSDKEEMVLKVTVQKL